MLVYNLCAAANTPCYKYVNSILTKQNIISSDVEVTKHRVSTSQRTKFRTYVVMNPMLTVNPIYSLRVGELNRIDATRLRLSSHNLAVETGRWARVDHNDRICSCPGRFVQSEDHVICKCSLTENVRTNSDLDFTSLADLFNGESGEVCEVISLCLKRFERQ